MNIIHISNEDAALFVQFQKCYGLIDRLNQAGFFTLTDGRVEILVDAEGRVGDIFIHQKFKGDLVRI